MYNSFTCILNIITIFSHKSCSVKIYDLLDLRETLSVISVEEENRVDCCAWSNDGRLLAVSGSSGNVYIYLTRLNMLASVWQPLGTVAVLTSLKEVYQDLKVYGLIELFVTWNFLL